MVACLDECIRAWSGGLDTKTAAAAHAWEMPYVAAGVVLSVLEHTGCSRGLIASLQVVPCCSGSIRCQDAVVAAVGFAHYWMQPKDAQGLAAAAVADSVGPHWTLQGDLPYADAAVVVAAHY